MIFTWLEKFNKKIWSRHLPQPVAESSDQKFIVWAWWSLGFLKFTFGLRVFYRFISKSWSPRHLAFALGASWMVGLFWQLIGAGIVVLTSYLGWWTWLWSDGASSFPPLWILTLGDTSGLTLLLLAGVTLILSQITGQFMVGFLFSVAAIFAGTLSLWGALTIVLTERLGYFVFLISRADQLKPKSYYYFRTFMSALFVLFSLMFGGVIISWLREGLRYDFWTPWFKLVEFGLLYAWWAAAETLITLTGFHYLWKSHGFSVVNENK